MGLEIGTYISDLDPSNPIGATDLVNEGDDHIRLLKSTILNTFPNVTGAMTLTHTKLNEWANLAATANNLTLGGSALPGTSSRVIVQDGDSEQLVLEKLGTGAARVQNTEPGQILELLVRNGADDEDISALGISDVLALFAVPTTIKDILTVDGGADDAQLAMLTAAGGAEPRVSATTGALTFDQLATNGIFEKIAAVYTRNQGWVWNWDGDKTISQSSRGLSVEAAPGGTANFGGYVGVLGEGENVDASLENVAGRLQMLVNNGLEVALDLVPGAEGAIHYAGARRVASSSVGAEVLVQSGPSLLDVITGTNDAILGLRGAAGGARLFYSNSEGSVRLTETDETGLETGRRHITAYNNDRVEINFAGVSALRSAGTTGRSVRGEIFHKSGSWQELGLGAWRRFDFSGNLTLDDTHAQSCGRAIGGAQTLTVNNGSLNTGEVFKLYNTGSGTVTIALGSGVTMTYPSGAGDVSESGPGNKFTVTGGSVAYITCRIAAAYEIEGNGIGTT